MQDTFRILIAIPCLYGPNHVKEAIESVVNSPATLLLIDNGADEQVKQVIHYYDSRPNVIVHSFPNNVYVNPAWNYAIDYFMNSDFTHLALMNSDLILHKDFHRTLETVMKLDTEMSCIPNMDGSRGELSQDTGNVLGPLTHVHSGTPGVFVMMSKRQAEMVYPIPDEIVVWFGDNWIYGILRAFGESTVVVHDFKAFHYWSKTIKKTPGVYQIIEKDKVAWENIVKHKLRDRIKTL